MENCRLLFLGLVLAQAFLSDHVTAHFHRNFNRKWDARQWRSRENHRSHSASSDSSSSSSSSSELLSSEPAPGSKKSCDPWISETLASLRAQVSTLEKLEAVCKPEKKADNVSPFVTIETADLSLCRPGYQHIQGRCYRFSQAQLTWHKARFNCTWDGADLVTLETAVEEKALTKAITARSGYKGCTFFTLGNDQEFKGFWLWGTGSNAAAVIYKNWRKGEPNDHGVDREACIEYNPGHGWNDFPCGNQLRFICEMAPGYSKKDLMKNTTDSNSSESKSSSSSSSESSSSESHSGEKHGGRSGRHGQRRASHRHGNSPGRWHHHHHHGRFHHGRFHHGHRHHGPHHPHHPHDHHHHHDRHHREAFRNSFRPAFFGGYDNHRDFHIHGGGHGSHENHYRGSHGHKRHGHHYHNRKSGERKSKSSSEEKSNSKENRVEKGSSSEEDWDRGHHYYNKPRFHHNHWFNHMSHGHYSGEESGSYERKYRKYRNKGGRGSSSHENHTPPLQSYFSRVVESWAKFKHHVDKEPEAAASLLHYFYPMGFPIVSENEETPSQRVENDSNSNEMNSNLTMNGNETSAEKAMRSLNLTEDMASNSSHVAGFNAKNKSMDEESDSKEHGRGTPTRRQNGAYVYSYLPPHRPQRIFYPGLAPPLFNQALRNPGATVHLQRRYYYGRHHDEEEDAQSRHNTEQRVSAYRKPVRNMFVPWIPPRITTKKPVVITSAVITTTASTITEQQINCTLKSTTDTTSTAASSTNVPDAE